MTYCEVTKGTKWANNFIQETINVADSYTGSDTIPLTASGVHWYSAVSNSIWEDISISGLINLLTDPHNKNDFLTSYEKFKIGASAPASNASSIEKVAYRMSNVWSSLKNNGENTEIWDAVVNRAVKSAKKLEKGSEASMFYYINGGFLSSMMKDVLDWDKYDLMMNELTRVIGREHAITKLTSETPNLTLKTLRNIDRAGRMVLSIGWVNPVHSSNFLIALQQFFSYTAKFMEKRGERLGAQILVGAAWVSRRATDFDSSTWASIGWWVNKHIADLERRVVSMIPWYDEGLTVSQNIANLKDDSLKAKVADMIINSDVHRMLANVRNNYGDMIDFIWNRFFETEAMSLLMQKHWISEVEARLFHSLPLERQQQILEFIRRDFNGIMMGLNGASRTMAWAKAGRAFEILSMFWMYMGQYGFLNTKNLFRLWNNFFRAMIAMVSGDFKGALAIISDPLTVSMIRQLTAEVNLSAKLDRIRRDEDDEDMTRWQRAARMMDNAATVGRYLQSPSLFSFGRIALWLWGYLSEDFEDQRDKDAASYKLAKSIASEFGRQFTSLRFGDALNGDFWKFIDGILGNKAATRLRITLPIEEETYWLLEDYVWGNYFNYVFWLEQPQSGSYYYGKVLSKWLQGKSFLQMMRHAETIGWQKKYFFPWEFQSQFQSTIQSSSDIMREITEKGSMSTVLRGKSTAIQKNMNDVFYKFVIGDSANAIGKWFNEITYDEEGNLVIETNEESSVDLELLKNLNELSVKALKGRVDFLSPWGMSRYLDVVNAMRYGNFPDGTKVYSTTKQKTILAPYAELIALLDNWKVDENYWPANFQLHQMLARLYDDKIKKWEIAIHRNADETWTINELPIGKKGYYSSEGILVMKEKWNAIIKNDEVRKQFIAETFWDALMEIAPISRPEMVLNLLALESEERGINNVITPKYNAKGDYQWYEFTPQGQKLDSYLRANINATNSVVLDDGDPIESIKWLTVAVKDYVYIEPQKNETQQQKKDRLREQARLTLELVSFSSDSIAETQWDPDLKALARVKLLDSNMSVMDYMSDEYEAWRLSEEDSKFWEDYVNKHLFRWASVIEQDLRLADIAAKIWNTRGETGWVGGKGSGSKWKKAGKVSVPEAELAWLAKTMENLQKRYVNSNTGFTLPKINFTPIKIPDGRKIFGQSYFSAVSNAITKQPEWGGSTVKSRVFTIASPKPSKSLKARLSSRKKSTKRSK